MYEWLQFAHLLGVAVLLAGLGVHVLSVDRLWQAARVTNQANRSCDPAIRE